MTRTSPPPARLRRRLRTAALGTALGLAVAVALPAAPAGAQVPDRVVTLAPDGLTDALRPDADGALIGASSLDETIAALEPAIGRPEALGRYPEGEPCRDEDGVAATARWGDLTASFDAEDRLVGYRFGPRVSGAPAASTGEGITVGSTVAELRAAFGDDLEVHDATDELGHHWVRRGPAPQLEGHVTGPGDDDTVSMVTAGSPCRHDLPGTEPVSVPWWARLARAWFLLLLQILTA